MSFVVDPNVSRFNLLPYTQNNGGKKHKCVPDNPLYKADVYQYQGKIEYADLNTHAKAFDKICKSLSDFFLQPEWCWIGKSDLLNSGRTKDCIIVQTNDSPNFGIVHWQREAYNTGYIASDIYLNGQIINQTKWLKMKKGEREDILLKSFRERC